MFVAGHSRLALGIALSVGLLLLAAKSHGRQVRLERELLGHFHASFGRQAQNPPEVEAIWRRDRIRFWSTYPLAAAALASLVVGFHVSGDQGFFRAARLPGSIAIVLLLWAPVVAFAVAGLSSAARFRRRLRESAPPYPQRVAQVLAERSAWYAAARRGSYLYWVGVFVGAALVAWVVLAP